MPAEAIQEFFDRFERALRHSPEDMLAVLRSAIPLSIILAALNDLLT